MITQNGEYLQINVGKNNNRIQLIIAGNHYLLLIAKTVQQPE